MVTPEDSVPSNVRPEPQRASEIPLRRLQSGVGPPIANVRQAVERIFNDSQQR